MFAIFFLFCFTAANESKSDIFEIVSCNDENKDGLKINLKFERHIIC